MPLVPPDQFWAKLRQEENLWHPLVAHSADVAAVAARLLESDSIIFERLLQAAGDGTGPKGVRALLVLFAGLHDVGKANHGFQERRFDMLGERGFPHQGHVKIVFQSLTDPGFQSALEEPFQWAYEEDGPVLMDLLAATIAHHGRPYEPADLASNSGEVKRFWQEDPRSGRAPLAEVTRIGRLAVGWSEIETYADSVRPPCATLFNHLVAGLVTLADWVGSTESYFPQTPDAGLDTAAYWDVALERADRACRDVGLVLGRRVAPLTTSTIYRQLFPRVFGERSGNRPTPLQVALAECPLPDQGTCLIVESETGSGKTEAALTLYSRLRVAGRVGGLMFALPTRATASAMRDRVAECVAQLYPDDAPPVVLAVGGQSPTPRESAEILKGAERTYPDEDDRDKADWASGHAKKFLAGEVVVGTVDQALLSALAVKHANLRLVALSRHFLVVDEVHSHDRYMLEALRSLLRAHADSGGVALLMSATLSVAARSFLGESDDIPDFGAAKRLSYPLVSKREGHGGWLNQDVAPAGREKEADWALTHEPAALAEAVEAARAGARVCVLRNTVRKARETVRQLMELAPTEFVWGPHGNRSPASYHSQYARFDRDELDRAVLRDFGPTAVGIPRRPSAPTGLILVATQVVEQSLDVDFDLLVTDLAPVDVLLQRMGRLHRHRRRDAGRPRAYSHPTMSVIAPVDGVDPTGRAGRGFGWGSVYENLPVLELTRRLVADVAKVRIPRDNRFLIETVYHPDRLEILVGAEWSKAMDQTIGRRWAHTSLARDALLEFNRSYPENASRYREERAIRTRLGDDMIRVRLDPPAHCWYAREKFADYVDLRVSRAEREGVPLVDPLITDGEVGEDGATRYPLKHSTLTYGPQGWEML